MKKKRILDCRKHNIEPAANFRYVPFNQLILAHLKGLTLRGARVMYRVQQTLPVVHELYFFKFELSNVKILIILIGFLCVN